MSDIVTRGSINYVMEYRKKRWEGFFSSSDAHGACTYIICELRQLYVKSYFFFVMYLYKKTVGTTLLEHQVSWTLQGSHFYLINPISTDIIKYALKDSAYGKILRIFTSIKCFRYHLIKHF